MEPIQKHKISIPQPPIEIEAFTLTLTREEMEYLNDIHQCIGGDPDHSRRKIADKMRDAISQALGDPVNAFKLYKNDIRSGNSLIFLQPNGTV